MKIELFRNYCLQFVGLQYKWGGDDTIQGFDCSGFAQEILEAFGGHPKSGTDLTAQGLYDNMVKVCTPHLEQVGVLVFYGKSYDRIRHVALMISDDLVIEAGGGGSRTNDEDDAARDNAYIRIRPMKYRKDFLGTLLPSYL
jgi:cell wall-associated NlpC family hydrolase